MFFRPGWGARIDRRAKPPFNRRGFSRLWGDGVRLGDVVGWGDVGMRGVLSVRVQGGTRNPKTNPRWLSDSLGLSFSGTRWLTARTSRASKRGRKKFESRLGVLTGGSPRGFRLVIPGDRASRSAPGEDARPGAGVSCGERSRSRRSGSSEAEPPSCRRLP